MQIGFLLGMSDSCEIVFRKSGVPSWLVVEGVFGYLEGTITQHPRLPGIRRVMTSAVLEIASDRTWANIQNTLYMLGHPLADSVDAQSLGDTWILPTVFS